VHERPLLGGRYHVVVACELFDLVKVPTDLLPKVVQDEALHDLPGQQTGIPPR
jgi:hypothetical protein